MTNTVELKSSETKQDAKQDAKQKVTLYLSPELHQYLKIRAAVEMEPMSTMAERALSFYLDHPEVVNNTLGSTFQVHHCPACTHPFVLRDGEIHSLPAEASLLLDSGSEGESDLLSDNWSDPVTDAPLGEPDQYDNTKYEALVPC